jgi:predicted dinucleotide-binding enzyme
MKRIFIAGVSALAIGLAGQAIAQSVSVEIGPRERTRIKEYVVKEKMSPVTVKERVTVGAVLPADVELRTVPADWGPSVTKYRYVYHDNHVVLVEPSSRRVVQIID